MKCRHIFSSPEVVHCDIAADLRDEQYEKARSNVNDGDHGRNAGWTTASALKELGLQPEQNVWRLVREAHAGLVRRYHPDVYASSNLPEELIRAAAQRLQRINEAFSYLRSVSAAKSHEDVQPT
jgi:DnaJ-domain-containing protein 1